MSALHKGGKEKGRSSSPKGRTVKDGAKGQWKMKSASPNKYDTSPKTRLPHYKPKGKGKNRDKGGGKALASAMAAVPNTENEEQYDEEVEYEELIEDNQDYDEYHIEYDNNWEQSPETKEWCWFDPGTNEWYTEQEYWDACENEEVAAEQ